MIIDQTRQFDDAEYERFLTVRDVYQWIKKYREQNHLDEYPDREYDAYDESWLIADKDEDWMYGIEKNHKNLHRHFVNERNLFPHRISEYDNILAPDLVRLQRKNIFYIMMKSPMDDSITLYFKEELQEQLFSLLYGGHVVGSLYVEGKRILSKAGWCYLDINEFNEEMDDWLTEHFPREYIVSGVALKRYYKDKKRRIYFETDEHLMAFKLKWC